MICLLTIPLRIALPVWVLCAACVVGEADAQALPQVSAGRVVRFSHFPSRYVAPRHVDVWLPPGYNGRKRHAVLYLHDGQMLFDSLQTWNHQEWRVDETLSRLIAAKSVPPVVVVGIWNIPELRRREYAPQKALSYLDSVGWKMLQQEASSQPQRPELGGEFLSDAYLKFLTTELKPFIDSTFRTKPTRKSTFIGGSSMGGLISLYAICEYPEVFGGAACLSTHWVGPIFRAEDNPFPAALLAYVQRHLPDPKHHKIYFDYGTATLDALYPPFQKQADVLMQSKGYTARNWMTRGFEGKDHSEKAWAERLHIPLMFLMQR